jgi:hypothetical protein
METMLQIAHRARRTGLALMAGLIALAWSIGVPPVIAQDVDDEIPSRVEIRVEDGRVTVNGKVVPEGTDLQAHLNELGVDDVTVNVDASDGEDRSIVIVRNRGGMHPFGLAGNAGVRAWTDLAGHLDRSRVNAADFSLMFDGDHGPGEMLGLFGGTSTEIMKKERESREVARTIRNAEGSERAELERQLNALLQEIFDEKEEIRRTKVAELQERLAKQQEEADARARDRDEIIARRKAELLGQQDRFDW